MTGKVTEHLLAAYEIGRYLIETFPSRDQYEANSSIGAYVVPSKSFENGPDPDFNQTAQGIILEVSAHRCPEALYTRYGTWRITEAYVSHRYGALPGYFARVSKDLQLEKIKETHDYSLWVVRKWRGRELVYPLMARSSEYHERENVRAAFQKFKELYID